MSQADSLLTPACHAGALPAELAPDRGTSNLCRNLFLSVPIYILLYRV